MPKNGPLTEDEISKIIELHLNGMTKTAISKATGRVRNTVGAVIATHDDEIAIKKAEKEEKASAARLGPAVTFVGDTPEQKPHKARKNKQEQDENTETVTPMPMSKEDAEAMRIEAKPPDLVTFGSRHNIGTTGFNGAVQKLDKSIQGSMADVMAQQFQKSLEMVPTIQAIQTKYQEIYQLESLTFKQFLWAAAELFADRIRFLHKQTSTPAVIQIPSEDQKGVNLDQIFNSMMMLKVLEAL